MECMEANEKQAPSSGACTNTELKNFLKEISGKISSERKRRGLSMSRLADMSNLSASHIFKLENDQCEIGLKALFKISTALSVSPAQFFPDGLYQEGRMQTNGDRFESITQGADMETIEFALKMTESMILVTREQQFCL